MDDQEAAGIEPAPLAPVRLQGAVRALTTMFWAMDPGYLLLMAQIARESRAQRTERRDQETWTRREIDAYAGPPARRMEGARYAAITSDGVAILPVFGPIFPRANMMTEMSGGTSAAMLQADYQLALANPDVAAILLLVDSPGGAAVGVNALADAIWAGRRQKLTVAHASGAMASAAYWIGSQAAEITAERTSVIGSIGVAAAVPKQVQPDAAGEITVDIVSSNAPNKRPDPASQEGEAEILGMLDGIEAAFIADVARGRNVTATKVKQDFGQGGVKLGQHPDPARDAVQAGMIDRVQSYDTVYRALARQVANKRKVQALKA